LHVGNQSQSSESKGDALGTCGKILARDDFLPEAFTGD